MSLDEIIEYSAKHVGFWDEQMSKLLHSGEMTNVYIDISSFKQAIEAYIAERENQRVWKEFRVLKNQPPQIIKEMVLSRLKELDKLKSNERGK